MKKLALCLCVFLASCELSKELEQKQATHSVAFLQNISGVWYRVSNNNKFSVEENGSFFYPKGQYSYTARFKKASSSYIAIYEINKEYYGVKLIGNNFYISKDNKYEFMDDVRFEDMILFANRSPGSSGGGSTGGGSTGGGDEPAPPIDPDEMGPNDPAETVPTIYQTAFFENLRLPYSYRDGDYFFKIADSGNFIRHAKNGGELYRFYKALGPRRALYRNEAKTQFYAFDIDSSGNLKRSAPSGTQNTGPTSLFAYRDDTRFDEIFKSSIAGRYESKGRIFTARPDGAFRVQDDAYNPVRIVSKTNAVYERFSQYYGVSLSNGNLTLSSYARGTNTANNTGFNWESAFATRYLGIAGDTAPTFQGSTDREKFLENMSGKAFYGHASANNFNPNGYFRAQASGNFTWHDVSNYSNAVDYTLSYVISPAAAMYGSTRIEIDPFGDLRRYGDTSRLFTFTTFDYEAEYLKKVSQSFEILYGGESYNLIRIVDERRAAYQKLADGKFYGISINNSGDPNRAYGPYNTLQQVRW